MKIVWFFFGENVLFLYLYAMTDRELNISLQQQILKLTATLESFAKIIKSQSQELSDLKKIILKQNSAAKKLQQFTNINLPKKNEKCKITTSDIEKKVPAPTPKERGNNGAKRKVYDNLEEIVEDVLPSDTSFNEKAAVYLFHRDVIRYKYIPPRLIKYIYR